MGDDIKVLHIMGAGRSGSTLLGRLLNEVDGFFATGELRVIWRAGLLQGLRCACGATIVECDIWSRVLRVIHEDRSADIGAAVAAVELQKRVVPIRRTGRLLRHAAQDSLTNSELVTYAELIRRLYGAVADVSRARVIVDSSKRASDAALLRSLDGISPYYVHLVRDPRAVAYSWRRRKGGLARYGSLRSTVVWGQWNRAAQAVRESFSAKRTMLVRYEDFTADPRTTLERIINLVEEGRAAAPVSADGQTRLHGCHMLGGNPDRFVTGAVGISADRAWVDRQSALDRVVTTAIAAPMLRRYGYPYRARSRNH